MGESMQLHAAREIHAGQLGRRLSGLALAAGTKIVILTSCRLGIGHAILSQPAWLALVEFKATAKSCGQGSSASYATRPAGGGATSMGTAHGW